MTHQVSEPESVAAGTEGELLPCPFCGGRAEMANGSFDNVSRHSVGCVTIECAAIAMTCEYETPAEAIAAWNRRAAVQPDTAPDGYVARAHSGRGFFAEDRDIAEGYALQELPTVGAEVVSFPVWRTPPTPVQPDTDVSERIGAVFAEMDRRDEAQEFDGFDGDQMNNEFKAVLTRHFAGASFGGSVAAPLERTKEAVDRLRHIREEAVAAHDEYCETGNCYGDSHAGCEADVAALEYAIDALAAGSTVPSEPDALADLRAHGWMVAVHNDYVLNGERRTFWLLSRDNRECVKGEGATDEEALRQIDYELEGRYADETVGTPLPSQQEDDNG